MWDGRPDELRAKTLSQSQSKLLAIANHINFPNNHIKIFHETRTKYEKATFCNPSKKLLNEIVPRQKLFATQVAYDEITEIRKIIPNGGIHLNRWKFSSRWIKQIEDKLGKKEFPSDSVCPIFGI